MSPRSLLAFALVALSCVPTYGALLWERADSAASTVASEKGYVAVAGTYADSLWITQVRPDGSEAWTKGWRVPVVRRVNLSLLASTPDGGWLVGADTSKTGVTGSWILRVDSTGNRIGKAMGIHYDTSLTVGVAVSSTEIWMGVQTDKGRPTTLFRFAADGTPLEAPKQVGSDSLVLGGLDPMAGGVLVRRDRNSGTPRVARWDLIRGTDSVWSDTVLHPGYFPKAVTVRDSFGAEKLLFLSDTGDMDYASGAIPSIRATVWDALSGRRIFDRVLDRGFPTTAWALRNGDFRIVGERLRSTASPLVPKYESVMYRLDSAGKTLKTTSVRFPDGFNSSGFTNHSGPIGVDGGGFVQSWKSTGDTIHSISDVVRFDEAGDSLSSTVITTGLTAVWWTGLADGSLVARGESYTGSERWAQLWTLDGSTSTVKATKPGRSSLGTVGSNAVLTLSGATNSAKLDVIAPSGQILTSMELGPMGQGRHSIEIPGRGMRIVRIRTDAREYGAILLR